jgi:hypothetical protein
VRYVEVLQCLARAETSAITYALVSARATSRRPLVLIEINDGPLVRPEVVFGEG